MFVRYPGKCKPTSAGVGCNNGKGGFTYVLAVPSDFSDPLYTNWTKKGMINGKPFINPVVNSTGDDPSTAWKTKDGEWRLIGNQACQPEGGNPIYGSMDFVSWYKIGCTTLMAGDCPTFFPLPALTPGSEHYVASHGPLPTHVHKSGGHGGDQVQVGTWTDGEPGPAGKGTVGSWEALPGTRSVFCDRGQTHASKDFHDPVKDRRILWIWGTVPHGIQAIPRTMTYHPGIKQIVYSPAEEMNALHLGTLDRKQSTVIEQNAPLVIKAAAAADIELFFDMPKFNTEISIAVGGGSFFISVAPPVPGPDPTMSAVGFSSPPRTANVSTFMAGINLPGNDYSITHHGPQFGASGCESSCSKDVKCLAWTWVVRGLGPSGSGDCCLKSAVPCPKAHIATCTSGAKQAAEVQCNTKEAKFSDSVCVSFFASLRSLCNPFWRPLPAPSQSCTRIFDPSLI